MKKIIALFLLSLSLNVLAVDILKSPVIIGANIIGSNIAASPIKFNGNGDNVSSGIETSKFRTGSWNTTASGSLYTLVGDFVVNYESHNVAIDASGNFLGRDDVGTCELKAQTEGGLIKTYSAVTAAAGVVPVFVLTGSYNIGTGAATFGSGVTGLVMQPYTSAAHGALYSTNVTPSAGNYALLSNGATTNINATSSLSLLVAASNIVSVSATGAAVTGTLSATGNATLGSGVTGMVVQPYTGGGFAALYNSNVTAGATNPALLSNATIVKINGTTSASLSVNTTDVVLATVGGAAVTGTLSATGAFTASYVTSIMRGRLEDTSGRVMVAVTSPTIASGFGTSPSITAFNTAAFKVTVGTGGAASGVLTFPAATTGWAVHCTDVTGRATIVAVAVSTSTTSVTVEAYSRTTGLASTFTAGDVLEFSALGY